MPPPPPPPPPLPPPRADADGEADLSVDDLIGAIDEALCESRSSLVRTPSLMSVRSSPVRLPSERLPQAAPRRLSEAALPTAPVPGVSRRRLPTIPRPRAPLPPLPPPPRPDTAPASMALLSQLAHLLACFIERATHIKRSVSYPCSFTGRGLVAALEDLLMQYVRSSPQLAPAAPQYAQHSWTLAMRVARSLKMQLYIHEVDWVDEELTDGVDDVYMFFFECVARTHVVPVRSPLFDRTPIGAVLAPAAAAGIASTPLHALPTGVFAPLTPCYSPACTIGAPGTCYSRTCPRAGRAQGIRDEAPQRARGDLVRAWVECVPAYIAASLPRAEVKRQNAIQEFIQKEEAFYADLLLLGEFAAQLRADARAPLRGAALDAFVRDVFFNCHELTLHIGAFVEQLHVRQREDAPVVQHIGDVVLAAALEWGTAYAAYVQHYPIAVDRLKREMRASPAFAQWVEECRRDPRAQRHPLDNFLFRAPARLQRYHLHLESILKDTDPANDDITQLELALDVVDEQCKVAQAGVAASEALLVAAGFARDLGARHPDTTAQFALGAPERTLVHHGTLFRRPDSFEFEWTELIGLLYDNCFVLARRKRTGQLALYRQPLALDFLDVGGFDEPPLALSYRRQHAAAGAAGAAAGMYPITVRHRDGVGELHLVYVTSAGARDAWRAAFAKATGALAERRASHAPFAPRVLAHWTHGSVSCAASFRVHGERLVALGGSDGLWLGLYGVPESLRKVLHLRNVMQCAVLSQFARFVVLADHTLYSYSLESLVPSGPRAPQLGPLKLSGHREVHAFALGELHGCTVLAYAKRKSTEMSVRILHAVDEVQMETAAEHMQRRLHRRPSAAADSFAGFAVLTKFYVWAESASLHFLFGGVAVGTSSGFQLYDPAHGTWSPLPAHTGTHSTQALARVLDGARGLAIFHVPDMGFLLCYDRGAFYVDSKGQPAHPNVLIEWELRPLRVAYAHAHVLAVCPALIAVYSAHTGALVQTLRFPSVRLLSTQYAAPAHVTDDDDAVIVLNRVRTSASDTCTVRDLAPRIPV